MLEEAVSLHPDNSDFHSEIAFQKSMIGDFKNSYELYQKASTFD